MKRNLLGRALGLFLFGAGIYDGLLWSTTFFAFPDRIWLAPFGFRVTFREAIIPIVGTLIIYFVIGALLLSGDLRIREKK